MLYIPNEMADATANASASTSASQGSQSNGNASHTEASQTAEFLPDLSTPISPAELLALETKYISCQNANTIA